MARQHFNYFVMNRIEDIVNPLVESGGDLYWLGQASDASIETVEILLGSNCRVLFACFYQNTGEVES
jgi:hypothetical protein